MSDIIEFDEARNVKKIYKLVKEFPRFNLYEVSVVDPKTNKEKFAYRETRERKDFGRRLHTRQEMLDLVNQKLNLVGDKNESSE